MESCAAEKKVCGELHMTIRVPAKHHVCMQMHAGSTYLDNVEVALEACFHESLDIGDRLLNLQAGKTVRRVGHAIAFGR